MALTAAIWNLSRNLPVIVVAEGTRRMLADVGRCKSSLPETARDAYEMIEDVVLDADVAAERAAGLRSRYVLPRRVTRRPVDVARACAHLPGGRRGGDKVEEADVERVFGGADQGGAPEEGRIGRIMRTAPDPLRDEVAFYVFYGLLPAT